jgi:hypothetical protein
MAKENLLPNLDPLTPSLLLQRLRLPPTWLPSKILWIRPANLLTAHPEGHSLRAQKGHSW